MRPELIHLITRLLEKDHADAVTGTYAVNSSSDKAILSESKA